VRSEVIKEVPVVKEVVQECTKEVVKEVRVTESKEVVREVRVEVPVEVIREVVVEKIVEVVKEVPKVVEVERQVIVEKPVEVIKEVIKEVVVEKVVEKIVTVEVVKEVAVPTELKTTERTAELVELRKEVAVPTETVREVAVEVPVVHEKVATLLNEVAKPVTVVKMVTPPAEERQLVQRTGGGHKLLNGMRKDTNFIDETIFRGRGFGSWRGPPGTSQVDALDLAPPVATGWSKFSDSHNQSNVGSGGHRFVPGACSSSLEHGYNSTSAL